MPEKWWTLPWVAWPAGWIVGVLSAIVGNWIWEKIRLKLLGRKDYLDMSLKDNVIRFEGQYTGSFSIPKSVEQFTQLGDKDDTGGSHD